MEIIKKLFIECEYDNLVQDNEVNMFLTKALCMEVKVVSFDVDLSEKFGEYGICKATIDVKVKEKEAWVKDLYVTSKLLTSNLSLGTLANLINGYIYITEIDAFNLPLSKGMVECLLLCNNDIHLFETIDFGGHFDDRISFKIKHNASASLLLHNLEHVTNFTMREVEITFTTILSLGIKENLMSLFVMLDKFVTEQLIVKTTYAVSKTVIFKNIMRVFDTNNKILWEFY